MVGTRMRGLRCTRKSWIWNQINCHCLKMFKKCEVMPKKLIFSVADFFLIVYNSIIIIIHYFIFSFDTVPPDTRIIRSCAWDDSNYKNKCYQRSGFGGRQEVCSCSTDLCNGSPQITPLVTVPLLLVAFLARYCL